MGGGLMQKLKIKHIFENDTLTYEVVSYVIDTN